MIKQGRVTAADYPVIVVDTLGDLAAFYGIGMVVFVGGSLIPHGGHNMFFKDRSGQWWATFFGNDPRAPFRERPAMLQIEFGPDGRVRPKTP